jgi:hypothetical protein
MVSTRIDQDLRALQRPTIIFRRIRTLAKDAIVGTQFAISARTVFVERATQLASRGIVASEYNVA